MTGDSPDIHALSGAYALDALDPDERAAFEDHLRSCASCRDEVSSFRAATAALAQDAATAPPDSLRAAVLSGIRDVRPLPPVVESGAPEDTTGAEGPRDADGPAERDDDAGPGDAPVPLRRAPRRPGRWLQVAAALLAVLSVGATWRAVSLDRQLGSVTAAAADVTAVLTAPDAATVSAPVATGGRAAVVSSASQGRAVLVTDGMPPAPAGRTYQIWFITGSGAASPAGFVPAGEHTATLLVGDLGSAGAVGVTVEPDGGSPQPTTQPVYSVRV